MGQIHQFWPTNYLGAVGADWRLSKLQRKGLKGDLNSCSDEGPARDLLAHFTERVSPRLKTFAATDCHRSSKQLLCSGLTRDSAN